MQSNPIAIIVLVVLAALAVLATQSMVSVDAGTVGVATQFGEVQEGILLPGLHGKIPFVTKVTPLGTRIQKVEAATTASSKDLQVVTSEIALNYRIDATKADQIFQELGPEYRVTIVEPALQESIKATTAKYTAEELITKRSDVAQAMKADLERRLLNKYLLPTDLSIIDFQFSPDFNDAIEQKQVALQAALRAENELEKVRIEATQAQVKASGLAEAEMERAKAESEAQKLLRETISAELLQLRLIEKWDGVLPVYSGGELPLPLMAAPDVK